MGLFIPGRAFGLFPVEVTMKNVPIMFIDKFFLTHIIALIQMSRLQLLGSCGAQLFKL